MGTLVELPIKTIFNGVSRQPPSVRQLGQVEDADNTLLSVVTGGFEKRPGTQHVAELTAADPDVGYAVHAIDRDSTEQYLVLVPGDGTIIVYDALTGLEKTVNSMAADAVDYLTASSHEAFAFVSVVDYTFVVNREVVVAKQPNTGWTAVADGAGTLTDDMTNETNAFDTNPATFATKAAATSAHLTKDWGAGALRKRIARCTVTGITGIDLVSLQYSDDGSNFTTVETRAPSGGSVDLWESFEASLVHRYTRVLFTNSIAGNMSVGDVEFWEAAEAKGVVQTFSALPGSPSTGDIYEIAGDSSTNFDNYFMEWDGSVWRETVAPYAHNEFDNETMPYTLIREVDGTFTFAQAEWAPRQTGDSQIAPFPSLLDRTINDVYFHKNRLGFLADEFCVFSQAGNYFDLWPEKATQILDSDGFEKAASTNKVTILQWAVPFRRSLFVTSEKNQFEVSSLEKFTAASAEIDASTTYEASRFCRPAAMGDTLYFASNYAGHSVIWEYFWDDDKFSSSAADITKHCETYVPQDMRQFAAVPASDRLFCLSHKDATEQGKLYVYTTYWDGTEKLQSAWCSWTFPDAMILGIASLGDYIYLVFSREGKVYLEKVTATTETDDPDLGFSVLLDRRVRETGTYDAVNDWTTFTLDFDHGDDLEAVLSGDWDQPGRPINILSYPTANTVRLRGDYGGSDRVYFGKPYTMSVELSKQYVRDANGAAIISGRTQLNTMTMQFRKTGYFTVEVMPDRRDTKTFVMPGALLGSADIVNTPLIIDDGRFTFRVNSKADTVRIVIKNDKHVPSNITSMAWLGFFTELSRQE